MIEFLGEWGEALSQLGLGGFAVYALVNVWNRLIIMTDQHRVDASAREASHRTELKTRDDQHRQEMREQEDRHREVMRDVVSRNMDEHRERNRVQTNLAIGVATAYAINGHEPPNPYPNIDDQGRNDPRQKG